MSPAEPSDRQLRAFLYHIAHVYLEVERGLRSPDHLERYLTAAEYRRHRTLRINARDRARESVLPTDIGHIHIDRHLQGQITAAIPTREIGDHWGALVLHLAHRREGWRIDQLQRLDRPNIARETTPSAPGATDLEQRISRVEEERKLVQAAHRATTSRIKDLRAAGNRDADGKQDLRQQRQLQRTWKRRAVELDHELDQLHRRRQLARETRGNRPHGNGTHPAEFTQDQLVHVLGPVPADPSRSRLWHGVADTIQNYRRRWNITDERTVLGAVTDNQTHFNERHELAFTLRAAARALGTASQPAHEQPARGTNRAMPTDQDPGRAAER